MQEEKMVMTVPEVAKSLGLSEKSAYKYIKTTKGFPYKKMGKRIIISKTAFLRWLEENSGIPS